MKKNLSVAAVFAAMLCLNGVCFAEELAAAPVAEPVVVVAETTDLTTQPTVITAETTAPVETTTASTTTTTATVRNKFANRERLRLTLMEQLLQQEADTVVGTSDSTTAGAAATEIADSTAAATAAVDAARVDAFVANLSEEQVFALNRSLNNAVQQRLALNYDLELLERIVVDQYSKQQINALTKALEEEAKLLARYERTGDEKFLRQAEAQKEKFLAKADGFSRDAARMATKETTRDTLRTEMKSKTNEATQSAVKEQTKVQARLMAKEAVKAEAKTMAKASADETTKGLAREAALALAKEESKQLARSSAQEAAKDVAKQAAKEVAKEVSKENQRASAKVKNNS